MQYKRWMQLFIGLMFYAVGIVFTINANMGLAPWDAFHMGLTYITHLSFGLISIIVGLLVLLITYQLNEGIGIGTIANIVVIGVLIDLIFYLNLIPVVHNMVAGTAMLIIGMELIALGSFFYIGSGFGTGPRDGLMVALTRTTKKPIGLIRASIEISVLIAGYLLGAKIGIGTLIVGFGIGPIVQITFKLLKFNVNTVNHRVILIKNGHIQPELLD